MRELTAREKARNELNMKLVFHFMDFAEEDYFSPTVFKDNLILAYDYIKDYMTGPAIQREDLSFIDCLSGFAYGWDWLFSCSDADPEEVKICKCAAKGLLKMIRNGEQPLVTRSGHRMLPVDIDFYVDYPEWRSYESFSDTLDLDNFIESMENLIVKKRTWEEKGWREAEQREMARVLEKGALDKDKILEEVIPSEEMREFLKGADLPPEKLSELICGAPIPLNMKVELLDMCSPSFAAEGRRALEELTLKPGELFTSSECWFEPASHDRNYSDAMPCLSYHEGRRCREIHDRGWLQWMRLDKWVPGGDTEFRNTYSYFILNGHAVFFSKYLPENEQGWAPYSFAGSPDLSLPVPFHPGDILTLNCIPFVPSKRVVLLDVEDGCSCLYRDEKTGLWCSGDISHSECWHYPVCNPMVSPFYNLKSEHRSLGDDEQILEIVSKYIAGDAGRGKTLKKCASHDGVTDQWIRDFVSPKGGEMMEPKKGVFWMIVDEEGEHLLACPFQEGAKVGVAKSGDTYNHRKLWDFVRPEKSHEKFNYYPRGRVEIDRRGRSIIYMSPHVPLTFLPEIRAAFGLADEPRVHYDFSCHYQCSLDMSSLPKDSAGCEKEETAWKRDHKDEFREKEVLTIANELSFYQMDIWTEQWFSVRVFKEKIIPAYDYIKKQTTWPNIRSGEMALIYQLTDYAEGFCDIPENKKRKAAVCSKVAEGLLRVILYGWPEDLRHENGKRILRVDLDDLVSDDNFSKGSAVEADIDLNYLEVELVSLLAWL